MCALPVDKRHLVNHVLKCQMSPEKRTGRILRCAGEGCVETFTSNVEYIEHVNARHEQTAAIYTRTFVDRAEYSTWMAETTEKGQFKWSIRPGQHRDRHVKKVHRVCSRSGDDVMVGTGERQRKARGSIKIDVECISFMTEKEVAGGAIEVSFCSDHFGHDLCVSTVPVRDTIKVCRIIS